MVAATVHKQVIKGIRIFSRDEKKQDDMRHLYNNDKMKYYIGDVRDLASIKNVRNCGARHHELDHLTEKSRGTLSIYNKLAALQSGKLNKEAVWYES